MARIHYRIITLVRTSDSMVIAIRGSASFCRSQDGVTIRPIINLATTGTK